MLVSGLEVSDGTWLAWLDSEASVVATEEAELETLDQLRSDERVVLAGVVDAEVDFFGGMTMESDVGM